MTNLFLNNYHTTWAEKLSFFISPVYSERHYEEYLKRSTWQGRAVHFVLSAVERAVVIGPLIALVEAAVALIWLKYSKATIEAKKEPVIDLVKKDHLDNPVQPSVQDKDKQPDCEVKPAKEVKKVSTQLPREEPPRVTTPIVEIKKVMTPPIETESEAKGRRQGAEVILGTRGFEKDGSDRLGRHGYKGEVQGNSALRFATARETKKNPRAISLFSLKEKRELNLEQYLILKCKRFAHAWNLRGFLTLPSGKEFNIEGFCEAFTVPMIASSFLDFAKDHHFFSKSETEWIAHEFNQTSSSDFTEPDDIAVHSLVIPDPDFCGPVSLGTGYDWHSTGTIFFGNYLIYCDRGGNVGSTGIHVIFLPEKSMITEAVIFEMTKRQEVFNGDSFGYSRIIQDLGGQPIYHFKMPPQSAGNCTYTSMLLSLYTNMILRFLINNHPEAHQYTDPQEWQEAFESLKPIYDQFVAFDQQQVLQDLLEETDEWLDKKNAFSRYPLKEIYLYLLRSWKEGQLSSPLLDKVNSVITRISGRN